MTQIQTKPALLAPARDNPDSVVHYSEVIAEHVRCDFHRDCGQEAVAIVYQDAIEYFQLCDRHLGWTGMRKFVSYWIVEL